MTLKQLRGTGLILCAALATPFLSANGPQTEDGIENRHFVYRMPARLADAPELEEIVADEDDLVPASESMRLALPDGTMLDIVLPTAEEAKQAEEEFAEKASETVTLTLPSGLNLSLTMKSASAESEQSRLIPRSGLALDESEDLMPANSNGVLVNLPLGSTVSITLTTDAEAPDARPATRKPPRKGIAEDDSDDPDTSDPEGLIATLPGGGTLRLDLTR